MGIMSPQLPGSFTKLVRTRETSIFYFPNQEGPTDESKNVSDAISRNNSFCTEKILFLTDHNVS